MHDYLVRSKCKQCCRAICLVRNQNFKLVRKFSNQIYSLQGTVPDPPLL